MSSTQEVGPEVQTPELADKLARIRNAASTIAGAMEAASDDGDDVQSAVFAIRAGRIKTAVELVGDNPLDLDSEPVSDNLIDTKTYQLTKEQWEEVVENLPLIDHVLNRFFYNLPQNVDRDDLSAFGVWGLMDATSRYSVEYGYEFSTFAVHRIRGAIIDHLRSLDRVPRSVRSITRLIGRAEQTLASRTGQAPTNREIAEELGLPTSKVINARAQEGKLRLVSIEQELTDTGENSGTSLEMLLAAEHGASALDHVEAREAQDLVRQAISKLTEKQRTVITSYYYDQKTLLEIGEDLGFTESRACQIRGSAIKRLRAIMIAQYGETA